MKYVLRFAVVLIAAVAAMFLNVTVCGLMWRFGFPGFALIAVTVVIWCLPLSIAYRLRLP